MAPTLSYRPESGYLIRSDDDNPEEWILLGMVKSPLAIENENFTVSLRSAYCRSSTITFTNTYTTINTKYDDQCPF